MTHCEQCLLASCIEQSCHLSKGHYSFDYLKLFVRGYSISSGRWCMSIRCWCYVRTTIETHKYRLRHKQVIRIEHAYYAPLDCCLGHAIYGYLGKRNAIPAVSKHASRVSRDFFSCENGRLTILIIYWNSYRVGNIWTNLITETRHEQLQIFIEWVGITFKGVELTIDDYSKCCYAGYSIYIYMIN